MTAHAHADLEATIEDAFERRGEIDASTGGAVREAVEGALGLLDRGEARVASRGADGAWTVHQWLKKAVLLSLPPLRHGDDPRRAGRRGVVGQGALQVRRLGRGGLPPRRLPRRAAGHRAPLGPYRARRRAHAVLREPRRSRGREHDGRHLGHGRQLRPDRRQRAPVGRRRHRRRAGAAAGGARSSSRTAASSGRAPRWSRASSCARARCWAWASISASPRAS